MPFFGNQPFRHVLHAETAALQRSSSEHISAVQGLIHGTKGSKRKRGKRPLPENGLTVEQFGNRRIGIDEPLAWQHMDSVVGMDYLRREYLRSREGIVTATAALTATAVSGTGAARFAICTSPIPSGKSEKRLSGRNMLKMKIPAKISKERNCRNENHCVVL